MQREIPYQEENPRNKRGFHKLEDKLIEISNRLALAHRGLGLCKSVHVSVGPQGDKSKERNLVRERLLRI